MNDYKELAIQEIKARIATVKDSLSLGRFERTPVVAADPEDLPVLYLHETVDNIIKYGTRSATGYPCTRRAEIVVELIAEKRLPDNSRYDIKATLRTIRQAILSDVHPVYENSEPVVSVYMREARIEGPEGYQYKGVIGMRLVIELTYPDDIA